ncbi:MAG: nuclear transport factor 2 family protein [Caulobacterales bacterium]|nr:nuclear transport factor 2 family protein [Caulobacterales bacterium]
MRTTIGGLAMAIGLGGPAALAQETDEAAVKTVVESVATLADRGEFDALAALYADEFMLDYSSLTGQPAELMSPRGLMLEWAGVLPGFDRTRHDLSAVTAEIDGARAIAGADVIAGHWIDGAYWEVSGSYDYALEKSAEGDWRITSMTFNLENETGSRDVFGPAMERAAADPPAIVIRVRAEQVVRDFLEGLERFDMDRVNAVWAEDAVQDMPYAPDGFPSRVVGRDDVIALYAGWPESVRDPRFTDNLVFYPMRDPEVVFAEWTGRADVVATGRRYEQRYGGLFHVEDGQIALYREYFDPRPFAWAFAIGEAGE